MADKIVVGPINKGLKTNRTAFAIDNDSFPTLINAYQWRGRIKRKRGTSFLGRLQRIATLPNGTSLVSGAINLFTATSITTFVGIAPGTINIVGSGDGTTYTDPLMNGTLTATGGTGVGGTINYATGAITITAGGNQGISGTFVYYPGLPVMGLEDFIRSLTAFPGTIAFDTVYSYNINTVFPYSIYDVSFYKNPSTGTYPLYVQKTTWTPLTWNGQDYQQFWTVNYLGALWATNGLTVPFSSTNIGMQYAGPSTTPALTAAVRIDATTMDFTIVGNPLVVGDFVFANEFTASSGGDATSLNFQTGYVITAGNTFRVKFPNANIIAGTYTPGILQYLTNRSDTTIDNIRWYDGDPTNGNPTVPGFSTGKGWVNFMPPLSQFAYSIADTPIAQYYLVGAKMIVPFKDRLLMFGPVIQTSAPGSQIYLQDTVIFSQNGTPYYTASFTGRPEFATTVFNPILVPINQTATAGAWWEDQTGFGGFVSVGIDQKIETTGTNKDVIITGLDDAQTQLVYTGNDILPFSFYLINSELGSSSTFSAINMNNGIMTRGDRGFTITGQQGTERIDLPIPDEVFEIRLEDNGEERLCAQRDFINEWIYWTYPVNSDSTEKYKFPNQTLLYNYRDDSWSIFKEAYTHYGQFRRETGQTWATLPRDLTWANWNTPWNSGSSTLLQPDIIAGNQQGFVLRRVDETSEATSLFITSFSGNTITSANHMLNNDDFITINGALGTIGALVNGNIFQVYSTTTNTFKINPSIASGTYLGGGLITRMYRPLIQTKQFPVGWSGARKIRLGPQQYLLTTTQNSQIQLLIYLSQNQDSPYNKGGIVPSTLNTVNNSLIYSTVLYTCPESTNLGLTPANINLNMVTAESQAQTWHRINTSLIGDTIQIGFTLSDDQMRDVDENGNPISQFSEIELHGFTLEVSPSQILA